jgi:hypothetical protein
VIVYDDRSHARDARDAWRETSALIRQLGEHTPSHDDLVSAVIAFGVYESALADALCPDRDEPHVTLRPLRALAESLGRAVAASTARDQRDIEHAVNHALAACAEQPDPECQELRLKVPEGYAYYSLYPESYADAIVEWAARDRPERIVAMGLRSIGTSLSAVVTGALRRCGVDTQSWTLRPRGHPFDRRIEMAPELASLVQRANPVVLIVDEGPGLSGSSMTATAATLSALGIADEQILFVPSWNPDPAAFVSAKAAGRWRRHRAILPRFERIRSTLAAESVVPAEAQEISAGGWRSVFEVPAPWPAVHPQHERRKFWFGSELSRFAGLGAYGHAIAHRANALADAGWSSRPLALRRGFLTSSFVNGVQMRQCDASASFLTHAASYITWLRSQFARGPGTTNLADLLLTNTREALGPDWLGAAEALAREASAFSEPAIAIDGRMQPHEWLATPTGGWVKTDALDHHRDHFLPGCTDAAWDVAGFIVEWDLGGRDGSVFADEYANRSGDRSIRLRLPYFTAAYAAFRTGYCDMAARALAGDDSQRFRVLGNRYKEALRLTLATARPAVPSAP